MNYVWNPDMKVNSKSLKKMKPILALMKESSKIKLQILTVNNKEQKPIYTYQKYIN